MQAVQRQVEESERERERTAQRLQAACGEIRCVPSPWRCLQPHLTGVVPRPRGRTLRKEMAAAARDSGSPLRSPSPSPAKHSAENIIGTLKHHMVLSMVLTAVAVERYIQAPTSTAEVRQPA